MVNLPKTWLLSGLMLHTLAGAAPCQETKAEPAAPNPVLIAKGKGNAYHVLTGTAGIYHRIVLGGQQLLHTNLETGAMRILFAAETRVLPTRRESYERTAIIGLAHDEQRLYLATAKTGRYFDANGRDAKLHPHLLRVYWLADGSLIHERSFPQETWPAKAPEPSLGRGPLSLIDNGMTIYGLTIVFRGKEVASAKEEPKSAPGADQERRTFLRKVLRGEIAQQVKSYQGLYKDDPKFKLGTTAATVLEQVKPAAYLPLRRVAAAQLFRWAGEEKVVKALLELLADEDEYVAFDAAQVLALAGRREAIPVLRKTLAGKLAVSNSIFEHDRSALALLVLGEKLPREFKWVEHPELEKYTERE